MYSMSKVILTGVTPSGSGLHVGNYFGAIKPLVELGQSGNRVYCFVSDLHALTTVQNRSQLENNLRSFNSRLSLLRFASTTVYFFSPITGERSQ